VAKLDGPRTLDVGTKLFFTSAKTGGTTKGAEAEWNMPITPVAEIFDYLAERVVRRWEWEAEVGAQVDLSADSANDTSAGRRRNGGLTLRLKETWDGLLGGKRQGCCS